MNKSQRDTNEYKMFWQVCDELRKAVQRNSSQDIMDWLDELEIIQINSDKVPLRKRCTDVLAQFRVAEAAGIGPS